MYFVKRIIRLKITMTLAVWRGLLSIIASPRYHDRVIYLSLSPRRYTVPAQSGDNARAEMQATAPEFGGGMYAASDQKLYDMDGGGGGITQRTGHYTLSAGGGGGMFNAGRMFHIGRRRLYIYPLVGVGGGGDGVVLYQQTALQYVAGGGGLYGRLGFGVDYRLGRRLGSRYGLILGLRVTYERNIIGTGRRAPRIRFIIGLGRFTD